RAVTRIALLHGDDAHAEPGHPERPARLASIRRAIEADERLRTLPRLTGTPASRDVLERVHDPRHLDALDALCSAGGGPFDADTYTTAASFDLARRACGNLLALVDAVMTEGGSGFALGRPPGHHATPSHAMGFCLLSNAAIAARHAQAAHGAERVLVVDVDVHHGNGTQDAFWDDASVWTVSSHQSGIYPGSGAFSDVGGPGAEGRVVNLPVPAGAGDEVADLVRAVLPAIARQARPDLILLAFGTDAHRLDPLAGLNMSVRGLAACARVVHEVADAECDGRLVATLEGGYHADALAASVAAVLRQLDRPDADIVDPFGPTTAPPRDLSALRDAVLSRVAP
ncbi:MAG: histone deacetylase, partial [Bacteroidota bacterium]